MLEYAPRTVDSLVISLSGDLDVFHCAEFTHRLAPVYRQEHVVLDFSAVRLLDCTAFGALMRMRRRRSQNDMPVERLVGVSARLKKIFRATQLDRVWPLFDTVDEAIESFREGD